MNFSPAPAASSSAADDAILVAQYVAGDDHAFALLLSRHQSRVFSTLFLIVRDRAVAEDLTQDTFIKAVAVLRAGRYADEGKFGAWICRIAHNLAIDATRRRKRTGTVSLDAPADYPDTTLPVQKSYLADITVPSPESQRIREEGHEQLRRLIQDLPAPQRQVLLMRHYGDMTFQEIANETGVSVNTALGRMRYALINLRRRMLPSATTGVSMLLAIMLGGNTFVNNSAAEPLRQAADPSDTFFSPDPDDSTLYPGNADPVCVR
jgi:RNA polymerase sigma factor (sigma-70 family)